MKKYLFITLLALYCAGMNAATADDLVAISKSWVFVADEITSNGTVGLTANTLYADNHIFSPGGNTAASNKGKSTFSGAEHLNSLRLKNAQNRLVFKVADACTVTFYGQSHGQRGVILSSADNITDTTNVHVIAYQEVNTNSFTATIDAAGTYYLTSYNGDIFLAGMEFVFAGGDNTPKTVSFKNETEGVLGTVPVAVDVAPGAKVTMPSNRTLYKEGYTLSGWTNGIETYAAGESFEPAEDVTLKAVFTENTYALSESLTELTVRWDFQRKNGAPNVVWEGRTGDFIVAQAAINGKVTDVKLDVNTTPGKFANGNWEDWCQVNEGTTFSFPAVAGSTVKVLSMYEPKNGSDEKSTVDGNEYSTYESSIATYAASPAAGFSSLSIKGGSYYRSIEVTYPASDVILPMKELTVNGEAVDGGILAAINTAETYAATLAGNVYTTLPVVKATMADDSEVVGVVSGEGSNRTYTMQATLNETNYTFTLNIEGVHLYTATGDEEAVAIKNNEGERADGVWTNGVYSLATNSLDGYNQYFKMNGNTYTLSVPADVVVKQLIFKECSNNYAGNDARLQSVTTEDATTYIPTENKFYHSSEHAKYDLIVNIEGHKAGEDIVFVLPKSGQPMCWIELTTVKEAPATAPVKTAEEVTISDNDAVVALTFDRVIANDVTATIGGHTVTAEGGSATLYFTAWDLAYSSNNTLTIAAGAIRDEYDNSTETAIEVAVNIPAKTAVEKAVYDYIVSDVDALLAAVAAVNESNTSAAAARKTIFIKNGEYDLGTEVGSGKSLVKLSCYNVSLIGESRDGVILYGETDGISNPVLNLRDRTGFYLQDLTIKNTHDYGNGLFNGGVAVAVFGGDKTIMKNVRLLSNQDTQVTGHRGYFEDCEIHGTVDFICGGGDNYYYRTDLVLENRGGDVIAAPSTNASHRWGYVFDHCTIKPMEGATVVTNGSYNLGRPWQNEPRANFLQTTMEVLPAAGGWTNMNTLPTHFYEYDSRDANNAAVDLSGRTNSPSSTNTYTPVLSDEEAASFTVRNVLGGTDAWDAAALAAQMIAPANVTLNGTVIAWDAVEDAKLYVVLKDGAFVAQTTETTYTVSANGTYTVKAANRFGGLGAASASVKYTGTATGVEEVRRDDVPCTKVIEDSVLYLKYKGTKYNVQGQIVK